LPQVTVSGFDHSYCMLRGARSQAWKGGKKDSWVVAQVAQQNGLTASVTDTKVEHPQIEQGQESDWAFVARLAERNGFEAYVRGDTLYFKPPSNEKSGVIELDLGFGLKSFTPELRLSEAVTEVEVVGWDVATKKEIVGRAGSTDVTGRDSGATTSSEFLRRMCKRGASPEAKKLTVRRPVYSQAQADAWARAILKRRAEDFVTGSGETFGIPELLPDSNIKLGGLGTFSKTYFVHQTTHTVDGAGYRTTFQVRETSIQETKA
jgi:phage protein D